MLDLEEWRAAIDNAPNEAVAHYNLGVALDEKGQRADAIAHWSEAIRLNKQLWEAHLSLANAFAEQAEENDSDALRQQSCLAYRQALAIEAHDSVYDADALRQMGYLEWKLGRKREAIETLKAALRIEPEDIWTHAALGRIQVQSGHYLGATQTAIAMPNLPGYDPSDYPVCRRCVLSVVAALVAVTMGGIFLYRKARR